MTARRTGTIGGDIEPAIAAMLDRKIANRRDTGYEIVSIPDLSERLRAFFSRTLPGSRIDRLSRMGGGGSKEQFRFSLSGAGGEDGDYVLRMDPYQGVVETDRTREFEVHRAMSGIVPVPRAGWLDAAGVHFGRPSIIIGFCGGVIKPTDARDGNITGMGLMFGERWRPVLSTQFLGLLANIHGFDWRSAALPSFQAPCADRFQAAQWQVDTWARIWAEDKVGSIPLVALTDRWLRENLPVCTDLVLVHGDYRSGNFLFDEASGKIVALLDWELAHIGDHHEDLGWILQSATRDDDVLYYSSLVTRDELIARYEAITGRAIDARSLHFYEVLGAYKCLCITLGTALTIVEHGRSHQDVLLAWMSTIGHKYQSQICDLLERGACA